MCHHIFQCLVICQRRTIMCGRMCPTRRMELFVGHIFVCGAILFGKTRNILVWWDVLMFAFRRLVVGNIVVLAVPICSVFFRTLGMATLHFVRVPPLCKGYGSYSYSPYSSVFFGCGACPTTLALFRIFPNIRHGCAIFCSRSAAL